MSQATMTAPATRNGVDTATLFATLDVVKGQPEIGQFQFRAQNRWVSGTHSKSTIAGFFGAGGEQQHKGGGFELEADHPEVLVGGGNAPTPVEFLLHGLAGCLTAGLVNIASARKIDLEEVESTVEGDIDLNGILGLSDEVRNGYEKIRVSFRIKGNAPEEKLQSLLAQSTARSAVYDVLTNGVPVEIVAEVESSTAAA